MENIAEPAVVVRRLIDYIRGRGLAAGDRLPPFRTLAAEFGVTPGAVRDAVMHAQTIGLVKVLPRSGAFVQTADHATLVDALADTLDTALASGEHNLFHVLDVRRLAEAEAAGLAAACRRLEDTLPLHDAIRDMENCQGDVVRFQDANDRFHLGIVRIAGNPVLLVICRALLRLWTPYLKAVPMSKERIQRTVRMHRKIYRAILDGDADKARAAMLLHMSTSRRHFLAKLKSGRGRSSLSRDRIEPPFSRN